MGTLIVVAMGIAVVAFIADWLEIRGAAARRAAPMARQITKLMRNGTVYTVTDRKTGGNSREAFGDFHAES